MNGNKSGESGAFLFSRRVPDFYDGRRPFPTIENSNLYRRRRRRSIFRKLLLSSPPFTNKHGVSLHECGKSETDLWGRRDGAVVRVLASHRWGPGSIPGNGTTCGLSLLLVPGAHYLKPPSPIYP